MSEHYNLAIRINSPQELIDRGWQQTADVRQDILDLIQMPDAHVCVEDQVLGSHIYEFPSYCYLNGNVVRVHDHVVLCTIEDLRRDLLGQLGAELITPREPTDVEEEGPFISFAG